VRALTGQAFLHATAGGKEMVNVAEIMTDSDIDAARQVRPPSSPRTVARRPIHNYCQYLSVPPERILGKVVFPNGAKRRHISFSMSLGRYRGSIAVKRQRFSLPIAPESLKRDETDDPSNMQWHTMDAAKAKDRWE